MPEPADRYGTAEALAQDFGRFMRGETIQAPPQARWEKVVQRLARRRRQIVTRTLLLALLLAVGVLAYDRYLGEKPRGELSRYANPLPGRFGDVVAVEEVNSPYSEGNVTCAANGLELYFSSRPADAVFILRQTADTNDTGAIDLTDAVYLLSYLFLGGPAPAEPFPACGPDPTIGELTCGAFEGCKQADNENPNFYSGES
jgi:hypothetical protein